MFRYRRPTRFPEIDAGRVLFYARYFEYGQDAIDALVDELPGGIVSFFRDRGLGMPVVRVTCDYRSPLRYGDVALVDVDVLHVGRTSIGFRHTIRRESDAEVCAIIDQVVVTCDLRAFTTVEVPDDLRQLLETHLVAGWPAARDEQPSKPEA